MKRILLVDDDRTVLQLLARALAGYRLTVAHDGFEALAVAHDLDQLDLLITDYLMPSMIGDELIVRARQHRPNLKVLVLTAHSDILDAEAPAWWQSEAHLAKPFNLQALRQQVRALIGDASSA